jgi:gamma-glutamylcyclotransferase (GGCT)/AIG2-like uncharacterized protein YtfP
MLLHLFVYGTLRPEFPHPLALRLKSQAKLIGKGSASGILYDFGRYPGAVFKADSRSRIVGEVFALKSAGRLLGELDHYEGTAEPGNPFRRVPVKVHLDSGGSIDAWSYAMSEVPGRQRRIESGDFIFHRRLRKRRPLRS